MLSDEFWKALGEGNKGSRRKSENSRFLLEKKASRHTFDFMTHYFTEKETIMWYIKSS